MKKIAIILSCLVLAGCGASTKHYLSSNANTAEVDFSVDLDKDFVKNMSTLGGGQTAMLVLVGPFTNNAILLEAKEINSTSERTAFNQRLKWGRTKFSSFLAKNTVYQLTVIVQGTRAGQKSIGQIQIGDAPGQQVSVILHGDEVSIK